MVPLPWGKQIWQKNFCGHFFYKTVGGITIQSDGSSLVCAPIDPNTILIMVLNFHQLIHMPTRITKTSKTIIDHIYCNFTDNFISNGTIYNDITDHFPIFAFIQNINYIFSKNSTTKRNYSKFQTDKFKETLAEINWEHVINCNNPNIAYNTFIDTFEKICSKFAPIDRQIQKNQTEKKPWITPGIKTSIKHKEKLYNKVIKNNFSPLSHNRYKKYKNMLTSIIRKSKKLFYCKQLTNNKNNSSRLWNTINEITRKKYKQKNNIPKKIEIENMNKKTIITDPLAIANEYNNFFVNIGKSLSNKINTNEAHTHMSYLKHPNENSIFMYPITEYDISTEIGLLNQNKSSAYDHIDARLLITATEFISEPLSHIINLSLSQGIFPDALKIGKILPIFKKGSPYSINNYRPISILPQISKIFEKIINKQLISFLNKYNILNKHQYGFRENHSTKMALIDLINNILNSIDDGEVVLGMFLDLSKAFDTIDHKILISKLNYYGIRGIPLQLFKNYLQNRKQFVQINEHKSTIKLIETGVPQGSILGPILYLLYINDLPDTCPYFDSKLFADDSNFFHNYKERQLI